MLKLFGTGKKKKSNHHGLKPGNLKIPIPMVNGVQYANMTESQISTLIGGGNKGEPQMKKSVSSISSQRTNNTDSRIQSNQSHQLQQQQQQQQPSIYPTRSISSPPVLLMPKPVHSVPPTRFILRSHDYEKTQVESSEEENSSSESSEEDDIIELFPSNPVHKVGPTLIIDPSQYRKEEPPLIKQRISEEREEEEADVTNFTNERVSSAKRGTPPSERNKNIYHQSLGSVTRTSDDSIRQYISASESPFFTTSSVSNMNNFPNNQTAAFPSSPLSTSSPITQQSLSALQDSTSSNLNTKNYHHNSFVSAKSFNSSELMDTLSLEEPPSTNNIEGVSSEKSNINTTNDLPQTEEEVVHPTTPQQSKREKTPLRYNNNRAHSSSPPVMNTATSTKQQKVTRPASSSASSATVGMGVVGHDGVTPSTQSRFTNNNEKPPGNQISSEQPALSQFDNNKNNILELLETTTGGHSVAISTMQKQQMTLTDDLEELKRTVDRMEQQRVSDREEHLNRVKEQKMREKEILDQINLTKQKLEMVIAGKFFAEDLHNTNDADSNALSASLARGNEMDHLQQQGQQGPPVMKASTSASSSKSRNNNGSKEASSSRQPRQQQQQQQYQQQQHEGRSRNRKSAPSSSLPRPNNNGDPYFSTESYFPDVSKTDFEYMNNLHAPASLHNQFLPPKFRGNVPGGGGVPIPNGGMRGFYPDMELMDGYDLGFDSPRNRTDRRHHHHHPQQQQRRPRSKSVESQWRAHDFIDQAPPQFLPQPPPQQPHYVGYDLFDPPMTEDYRYGPPPTPRTRSRKSSTHSARSNLSSEGGPLSRNTSDLHSGYHSAAEEEEDVGHGEVPLNNNHNGGIDAVNDNNHRMDNGERQQPDDQHRISRNNSGKYRRNNRPPPPHSNNGNMNGHLPMMYHHNAFGPPPPMMGMMNDNRDRSKMRAPPYGYGNMPPPGNEYYPYMHQRVSPHMLAAEQQWTGGPPPPPHWGPPPPGGNYGMPPPQSENNNPNTATNNNVNDVGNGGQNDFGRRYPPPQTASLQQTPQQSQHGYLPIYADAPHRLYM